MAKKTNTSLSVTLLGLAVGVFLLLSGVQNLVDQNSLGAQVAGFFTDKTVGVVTVVAAILKVVSGAVLVIGPFGLLTAGIRKLAFGVIFGFWAVLSVWLAVVGLNAFQEDVRTVLRWFENLALNAAILAALWQIKPSKG